MDPPWPFDLGAYAPAINTGQAVGMGTDQRDCEPPNPSCDMPAEGTSWVTARSGGCEGNIDHHDWAPPLQTASSLGFNHAMPTSLFSYSALQFGSDLTLQYHTAAGSQPASIPAATQPGYATSNQVVSIHSLRTSQERSNPNITYDFSKGFDSIRPTVENLGMSMPTTPQNEDLTTKRQILGILYPVTRDEIEAGGHVGFGKARIEISLDRPCACTHIDDPILWVLTPDRSVAGRCSYPERTWIRIESRFVEKEISRSNLGTRLYNISHDLDKTRRNTHPFFQDVKVRVKVKARYKGGEGDEPREIDSLHTPIAAAFTYIYTWQHRGHCSGMTASKYFSVGISNAKPHLSVATEVIRKRRRTGSSPVLPSSNTTNSISGMDATNVDIDTAPPSVSPAPSLRLLHTAGAPRPMSALHNQANRSLNDFVLFLSGRRGKRLGLTDPKLTAECDAEGRLRLRSLSSKSGPGILTLLGATNDEWLEFLCNFAGFMPILMQFEDLDTLRAVHRASVTQQLLFLHQVLHGANAVDMAGRDSSSRDSECIQTWMSVLAMVRSHCDTKHEIRFDCILILNQEVLNDIMIAEDNHFAPNLAIDPSDIQYLAGLVYSECLRAWKSIIGMAPRRANSWEERWAGSSG